MSVQYKKKLLWHQLNAHREGEEKQAGLPGAWATEGLRQGGSGRAWGPHCGLSHLQSHNRSMHGSGSDSPSMLTLAVRLLQDLCGGMLLFFRNSLCWLLAFVGLLEAGAGHLCHNPDKAKEVPVQGNGGGSRGRLRASCWLRSSPRGLGLGKCWHITGLEAVEEVEAFSISPSFSLCPPSLPAPPPSSPLSTLDHLHQVDIRRVYSGVCNCILSPVLHYQP